MDKEKIISDFIELASKSRKALQALKTIACKHQNYVLASELRKMETEIFAEAKTTDPEYKEAEKFSDCLRMTAIEMSPKAAYVTLSVARKFQKMGGKYDIDTSSKIQASAEDIFGEQN